MSDYDFKARAQEAAYHILSNDFGARPTIEAALRESYAAGEENLRAEVKRLREALERFARRSSWGNCLHSSHYAWKGGKQPWQYAQEALGLRDCGYTGGK